MLLILQLFSLSLNCSNASRKNDEYLGVPQQILFLFLNEPVKWQLFASGKMTQRDSTTKTYDQYAVSNKARFIL